MKVQAHTRLPHIIEPGEVVAAKGAAFFDWVQERRDVWEGLLLRHGALVFRGFEMGDGLDALERFISVSGTKPMDYVGGTSVRRQLRGPVYSSTEIPEWVTIPVHQEMSYSRTFPRRVVLFCAGQPEQGGQTSLADMRRVYERLPEAIRSEFAAKGLRLMRSLPRRDRMGRKTWPEAFGTNDPKEVDRIAAERGWTVRWRGTKRLQMAHETVPAVLVHPSTGESVWFNQAHGLHHSALGADLWRDGRYLRWLHWRSGLPGLWRHDPHTVFGDGSEIDPEVLRLIRSVIHAETALLNWRNGDLLLVDNILVAHGRKPFHGRRTIMASLLV